MKPSMEELVKKHGAKKPELYWPIYDDTFDPLRDKPIRVLELGVYLGGSIRMWLDYFPAAQVTGVDINEIRIALPDRGSIYRGDATDVSFLDSLAKERGPWDIIIDDASHLPAHWWASYCALWRHLVPGGHYAIEDLCAPRHPELGWPEEEEENMQHRLADLVGPMVRQDRGRYIYSVTLYASVAMIRKAIR